MQQRGKRCDDTSIAIFEIDASWQQLDSIGLSGMQAIASRKRFVMAVS